MVEDGIVCDGGRAALRDFLAESPEWDQDAATENIWGAGLSFNHGGYLRRRK